VECDEKGMGAQSWFESSHPSKLMSHRVSYPLEIFSVLESFEAPDLI